MMASANSFEGSSFLEKRTLSQASDLTSPSDSANSMFNLDDFPASDFHGLVDGSANHDTEFDYNFESASPEERTVSPKDLFTHNATSEPPSAAFTDLTTPATSILESPYMANSSAVSPLVFNNASFDENPDEWPSLFADTEELTNPTPCQPHYTASPQAVHVAPKMSRNDSQGQSSTRSSHQGRHSFTSGVASKRRDKPLPAITVEDPTDIVAVKRARNTLAARKSREKRVERTEALLTQVEELQSEVEHWKNIARSYGHVE